MSSQVGHPPFYHRSGVTAGRSVKRHDAQAFSLRAVRAPLAAGLHAEQRTEHVCTAPPLAQSDGAFAARFSGKARFAPLHRMEVGPTLWSRKGARPSKAQAGTLFFS